MKLKCVNCHDEIEDCLECHTRFSPNLSIYCGLRGHYCDSECACNGEGIDETEVEEIE